MEFYTQTPQQVLEALNTTPQGLTDSNAKNLIEKYGENQLAQPPKDSLLKQFLHQLKDPMTLVLAAAAFVSILTGLYSHEGFTDSIIIIAVILINSCLGVFQENKAEKAIEALQTMTAATCKVKRNGHIISILNSQLVPGDIVILEAGDSVPADGRIIESAGLKIEEASLTGESVPSDKTSDVINTDTQIPLGDRKNMIYMGSTVVYGRGQAVICKTGMDTEMGKIANALINTVKEQTPLQKKLGQLGKTLSFIVLGICVFMFAFTLFKGHDYTFNTILDTFMIAVALAVAAIPEGLTTVVTLALSIGVTNMSKRNAVIRKLTAVETLGCAQVICSDKTGTLTQNKMTVTEHYGNDKDIAKAMALCSDAFLDTDNTAKGEPTEAALVNFAYSLFLNKSQLEQELPRINELPFDSSRKMMTTLHKLAKGSYIQYTKGAPDVILNNCAYIDKDGVISPLTQADKDDIMAKNKQFADKALRVLAVAYKNHDALPQSFDTQHSETDMVFIGLTGMIDPIRPEVLTAVAQCKSAGIRPVMITGDHKDTAVAIAKELGILAQGGKAISGSELEAMSQEEYEKEIKNISVYARVQPEHKTRIVTTWKKLGFVTAMTGDGVNDAPSIKSSDIGIGMGITGTDVTKNVADMVLADDNFATIVVAVEEGRRIYDNIKKSVQFLLASNISEVIGIFVGALFGFTLLKPVHLLWINLITDTFPALALGMEKAEKDIMERNPRPSEEGIFAGGMAFNIAYQGTTVALLTLIAYFIGIYIQTGAFTPITSELGISMAFLTLSMSEIFHSFNMRSQHKSIFSIKHHNLYLWGAMLGSFLLTLAVMYIPALASGFSLIPLTLSQYLISTVLAFLIIPLVEIVKFIQRSIKKQ